MPVVFDSLLDWLHAMGDATNAPVVLVMLAAAAAIEYIIPPFPGDSITLLGGVLVSAFDWCAPLVFGSVMLGSVTGSLVAFALGRRLIHKHPSLAAGDNKLARLVAQFRRRGTWFLLLNRFMPGIRPLFFVAAGLAGMSTRRVALLSTVSAGLWNLLIMAAGAAIGDNLPRLEQLLRDYSTVAWIVLVTVGALILVRNVLSRSRPSKDSTSED